jgi:hypothetical protein
LASFHDCEKLQIIINIAIDPLRRIFLKKMSPVMNEKLCTLRCSCHKLAQSQMNESTTWSSVSTNGSFFSSHPNPKISNRGYRPPGVTGTSARKAKPKPCSAHFLVRLPSVPGITCTCHCATIPFRTVAAKSAILQRSKYGWWLVKRKTSCKLNHPIR